MNALALRPDNTLQESNKILTFDDLVSTFLDGKDLKATSKNAYLSSIKIFKVYLKNKKVSGWGTKLIETLAKDLQNAFPGISGFSKSNIFRMRAFYRAYNDCRAAERQLEKLPIFKIPWTHNVLIFEKGKDCDKLPLKCR